MCLLAKYFQASFAGPLDLLARQTASTAMSEVGALVASAAPAPQAMDVVNRPQESALVLLSEGDCDVEDEEGEGEDDVLLDGDHARVDSPAGSSESDVEIERSAEAAAAASVEVRPFSLLNIRLCAKLPGFVGTGASTPTRAL